MDGRMRSQAIHRSFNLEPKATTANNGASPAVAVGSGLNGYSVAPARERTRSAVRFVGALFAVALSVVAPPARAVVMNVTTGKLLFYDDFESTTRVSHTTYGNQSEDYRPANPRAGTWTVKELHPSWVQVTDSKTPPDPGAYHGAKYLRVFRDTRLPDEPRSHSASNPQELLIVKAGFAPQSTLGDHIRMAQMVYVPAVSQTGRGAAQLVVSSGKTNVINVCANMSQTDGSVYACVQGKWVDTGLDFTAGQWQLWQIDYKIGDSTFTLTIGATSASGLPMEAGTTSADGLNIHAVDDALAPYYIDEVVEPSHR